MTTQEILSSLAIELGLTGKSASTCVTYTGCVRYFSGHIGKSLTEVDRSDVARFMTHIVQERKLTATTVNFRAGPFGRLLCAGVDYQIEHHLFPGLGHTHYRRMAPQVEAFCRAHGYPYRVMSWRAAVWKSLRAMATPRPVVRELKDLRLAGEAPRTRRA